MPEDMDINAGRIVDGTATLDRGRQADLRPDPRRRLRQQTASEELDIGHEEFIPWQFGAVT